MAENTTETTPTADDPRKVARKFEILFTECNAEKIKIMGMSTDDEEFTGTLTIKKKSYDEDTKEFVNDPEVYAEAADTLTRMGLGAAVSNGEIMDDVVTDTADEVGFFEGYVDPSNNRLSLDPIKVFEKPVKITAATNKHFKSRARLSDVLVTEPLTLWEEGMMVQMYFRDRDETGADHLYKISQVLTEDENGNEKKLSVKFSKGLDELAKRLREGKVKADKVKKMERFVKVSAEKQYKELCENFDKYLGWNIPQMVEEGARFKFTRTMQSNDFKNETHYFILANPVDDDEEAVNADLTETE